MPVSYRDQQKCKTLCSLNYEKIENEVRNKMTEQKEKEFANQVEVIVKDVSFKMDKTGDKVLKVGFETDKDEVITFKPKIVVEERVKGIKVRKEILCNFDQVHEKVFEISEEVNSKGSAKVKASYNIWNTIQDGLPATYRFVNGDKMLESWKVIKEEAPASEVVR